MSYVFLAEKSECQTVIRFGDFAVHVVNMSAKGPAERMPI